MISEVKGLFGGRKPVTPTIEAAPPQVRELQIPRFTGSAVEIASGYFAWASTQRPAMVPLQAALISLGCQQNGHSPEVLGQALGNDPVKIDQLFEVAKIHHVRAPRPVIVSRGDFEATMRNDFNLANGMMILAKEELEEIANEWGYLRNATLAVHEQEIIEKLIEARRASGGTSPSLPSLYEVKRSYKLRLNPF